MLKDKEKVYLGYNDVEIMPSRVTCIEHREDINPYASAYPANTLPIFASPMTSVIDENTYKVFKENGIIPILPRNIDLKKRLQIAEEDKVWITMSLDEFIVWSKEVIRSKKYNFEDGHFCEMKILVDIANGHMRKLLLVCEDAKRKIKGLTLMAGNIANPETVHDYVRAGIDYIRIGIGGGSGCLTTSNCGIHCPMATLVEESRSILDMNSCYYELTNNMHRPVIVADGGIRNYDDVIKALALGADYVMIGGLFSSCIESGGEFYGEIGGSYFALDREHLELISKHDCADVEIGGFDSLYEGCTTSVEIGKNLYKKFYGMASKKGQEVLNGEKKKTAEGLEKMVLVDKRLSKWVKNMADFLRSAMSYTNTRYLSGFYFNAEVIRISKAAKEAINK